MIIGPIGIIDPIGIISLRMWSSLISLSDIFPFNTSSDKFLGTDRHQTRRHVFLSQTQYACYVGYIIHIKLTAVVVVVVVDDVVVISFAAYSCDQ